MKTIVKRHGMSRHGFNESKVICPDCKSSWEFLDEQACDYIDNKYRKTYECDNCRCLFEVESDVLQKFD